MEYNKKYNNKDLVEKFKDKDLVMNYTFNLYEVSNINVVAGQLSKKTNELMLSHLYRVLVNKCDYPGALDEEDLIKYITENDIKINIKLGNYNPYCDKCYEIIKSRKILSSFLITVEVEEDILNKTYIYKMVLKELE